MPEKTDAIQNTSDLEVVAFYVGDMLCAMESGEIREIINQEAITFVYHAPSFIKGVVNLRGQIVTIVDLKEQLQIPESEEKRKVRILITEYKGESIGLLVDSVEDILMADSDNLSNPPSHLGDLTGIYIRKILQTENNLIAILNIEKILETR
ncbi:MAG: hypothetical protein CSA81_04530 [Acidobacteria bacterium]|nr:MAG: hypothetical protein CSA81_04530 [Acidobacteriota bacterium]PIE89755.1 MAG: hypothetical protein CR997_09375 [Acidobacteriota bacterium]